MLRTAASVIAFCLLSVPAIAQQPTPPPSSPPPPPPQLAQTFCVYNNKVFSLGSVICIGPNRGFTCNPKDANHPENYWVTDPNANNPMNDGCKGQVPSN
jgi:hypothetical protein